MWQPAAGFTTVQALDVPAPPTVTASDGFFEFLLSHAPEPYDALKRKEAAQVVRGLAWRAVERFRIIRYRINMTDAELARALERGEAPNDGFHHIDHLRVALVYLNDSPSIDAAVDRMAATLRRFAASVGQAEKYSQATTEFWMYQMAAVRAVMPAADCEALLTAYPRLLDKNLILAR